MKTKIFATLVILVTLCTPSVFTNEISDTVTSGYVHKGDIGTEHFQITFPSQPAIFNTGFYNYAIWSLDSCKLTFNYLADEEMIEEFFHSG